MGQPVPENQPTQSSSDRLEIDNQKDRRRSGLFYRARAAEKAEGKPPGSRESLIAHSSGSRTDLLARDSPSATPARERSPSPAPAAQTRPESKSPPGEQVQQSQAEQNQSQQTQAQQTQAQQTQVQQTQAQQTQAQQTRRTPVQQTQAQQRPVQPTPAQPNSLQEKQDTIVAPVNNAPSKSKKILKTIDRHSISNIPEKEEGKKKRFSVLNVSTLQNRGCILISSQSMFGRSTPSEGPQKTNTASKQENPQVSNPSAPNSNSGAPQPNASISNLSLISQLTAHRMCLIVHINSLQ
jgi:hypothetical protein